MNSVTKMSVGIDETTSGRNYATGGNLTFDMSGSHKWAKPACDCPFDGRVRRHER